MKSICSSYNSFFIMSVSKIKLFIVFYLVCIIYKCNCQMGPDPWDVESHNSYTNEDDLPPDLRLQNKVIEKKSELNQGISDWFYKRLLAILLKSGQKKENEDGSIDVSLQMNYNQEQIDILDAYITSKDALSEDMYRRSIGFIEGAIYKPTITEEIVIAWNEYIYIYLIEYKEYITWGLSILACITSTLWLWQYVSYNHLLIILGVSLYLYEAFISYKEAEKEEVLRFLSAVNTCKWFFWTTECEVTPPDPLIMLKHMNPLKIGIRMFTTIVSEPMLTISTTVNTMLNGITADLMYPFNKILQGILVLVFNALLIMMLVSITFNYILNVPYQLNFFNLSMVLPQRYRSMKAPDKQTDSIQGDRITGETLNKVLDVCSKALDSKHINSNSNHILSITKGNQMNSSIRRSASAGRLSDIAMNLTNNNMPIEYIKNKVKKIGSHQGSGDV